MPFKVLTCMQCGFTLITDINEHIRSFIWGATGAEVCFDVFEWMLEPLLKPLGVAAGLKDVSSGAPVQGDTRAYCVVPALVARSSMLWPSRDRGADGPEPRDPAWAGMPGLTEGQDSMQLRAPAWAGMPGLTEGQELMQASVCRCKWRRSAIALCFLVLIGVCWSFQGRAR